MKDAFQFGCKCRKVLNATNNISIKNIESDVNAILKFNKKGSHMASLSRFAEKNNYSASFEVSSAGASDASLALAASIAAFFSATFLAIASLTFFSSAKFFS